MTCTLGGNRLNGQNPQGSVAFGPHSPTCFQQHYQLASFIEEVASHVESHWSLSLCCYSTESGECVSNTCFPPYFFQVDLTVLFHLETHLSARYPRRSTQRAFSFVEPRAQTVLERSWAQAGFRSSTAPSSARRVICAAGASHSPRLQKVLDRIDALNSKDPRVITASSVLYDDPTALGGGRN